MTTYKEFIATKLKKFEPVGFDFDRNCLNPKMFDYQKDITIQALKKGKYAVFADCGLGKTIIQLEWALRVANYTNKSVLILAPLEVCYQTIREAGEKLGFKEEIRFVNCQEDLAAKICITNYEKLERFDCENLGGVVLDESSILKSYTGKTKRLIFDKFTKTPYKLSCTATPSPNDYMEILNQAEFLDILKSSEALSEWFINDTMNFGGYRLKKHAKSDFYKWLCSWCCFIDSPSDLGYSNKGFELPKLNITEKIVETDLDANKGENLFRIPEALNATNFNKEKRASLKERLAFTKALINESNAQWVIWVETNEEGEILAKELENSFEVRGATPEKIRHEKVLEFLDNKLKVLISKPSIFGYGLNFQNCQNTLFFGLSFSFENHYQAIKRFHRFGQDKDVNVFIVIGENEKSILDIVNRKKKDFIDMKETMKETISTQQNLEYGKTKEFKSDYVRQEWLEDGFRIINGDSCQEIKDLEDESVDFQIFSPPFSSLYIYSDSYLDMGNCKDDSQFFEHFKFLIPELYRILAVGRVCAVHCKQLVNYAGTSGKAGLRDFRGDLIRAFTEAGFAYHSEMTIWKDPVIEMQRTKAQGLLYKQLRKDSSYSRVGMPEYLLIFRKWGDKAKEKPINWKTKENFSLEKWQNYASPITDSVACEQDDVFFDMWRDIRQTNVLNAKIARDNEDEKHICPLQLDVIEKAIDLYTNPDDVVFTPFCGIGSELYQARKMGRRGVGIELKDAYFKQSIANVKSAKNQQAELF